MGLSTKYFAVSGLFFEIDETIFAIEAYIPENNFDKLYKLLEKFSISYEKIAFEKDEKIPTYLENKNFGKIGEDIIKVYDTPATDDSDPSRWVLWAFAAFFAIIISDAGYGFIYLMLALFLKLKFKKPKPMIKRFTNLTLILSTCTIFWGICSGSFFGMGVNPKNPLDKITLLNFISEKKTEYHMRMKDDVYSYWHKKYPKVENAKDGKEFIILAAKVDNNKISYEVLDAFKNNILAD